MTLRALTCVVLLGIGCATVESVPFCASTVEVPAPTPACSAEPGVQQMAQELADLIDAAAGPFLIQVEFDQTGGVGSMCAQRSPGDNPWHPRKRLGEKTAEVLAVAPGSACLAGRRLDFNQWGAKDAELDLIRAHCAHQAERVGDTGGLSDAVGKVDRRRYRRCLEDAQIVRGEIWGLVPEQVFVRSETGVTRAAVLRACTQNVTGPLRGSHDAAIQKVIVNLNEIDGCMREHGWEPLFP